jgi:hypothetical protein
MIEPRMLGSDAHARALRLALAAALLTALAAFMIAAPSAGAVFHLMKVREAFPGDAAQPGAEFVELQMHASNQNAVTNHPVRLYDANGTVTSTETPLTPAGSGQNQRSILFATADAEAKFVIQADYMLDAGDALSPAGGAACFENIDCVSWGSFSGSLPSPAGTPAPAITNGQSLTRSIARGCRTLLEPGDDTDDSAADFTLTGPSPRPNSVEPTETACTDGGADDPPQTRIRKRPENRTEDRTPTFRFRADEPGSRFRCSLDDKRFKRCRSPFTTKKLSFGRHTFEVAATDADGNRDRSPARDSFRVVRG